MASKAKVGRGTIVAIGATTGGVAGPFVPIEELTDASFSGGMWGTDDSTSFDSGVDEEFLTTTRNNGEVTLKGHLIDGAAGQVALSAAYGLGDKHDFTIQLKPGPGQTVGTLYAFSALVMSFFDITLTTKGIVQFNGKLKVSGPIATTAGH